MTDWKGALKSNITAIEKKAKKKVQIKCHNPNAGKKAYDVIGHNGKTLYPGSKIKNKTSGFTMKDFTLKMDSNDGADELYDNINDILNDSSIPQEAPEESGTGDIKDKIADIGDRILDTYLPETSAPAPAPPKNDNTTVIVVGAAFVMLIVIILVVWKMQK